MSAPDLHLHLQVNDNGHHYDLTVTPAGDLHQVKITGSDPAGEQIAELRGTLPLQDLPLVVRLLSSATTALVETAPARPGASLDQRRLEHGNSHRPWTQADDERLCALAAQPEATVVGLMEELGRSRGAIRSRLERLGVGAGLPMRPPANAAKRSPAGLS